MTDTKFIAMEEPIVEEEIKLAITRMKNNTTPGPDCLTIVFHKAFMEELSLVLKNLYNHSLQIKCIPATWNG